MQLIRASLHWSVIIHYIFHWAIGSLASPSSGRWLRYHAAQVKIDLTISNRQIHSFVPNHSGRASGVDRIWCDEGEAPRLGCISTRIAVHEYGYPWIYPWIYPCVDIRLRQYPWIFVDTYGYFYVTALELATSQNRNKTKHNRLFLCSAQLQAYFTNVLL